MNNLDKLVSMFKERQNPNHPGIVVGEVISASPLRIKYGNGAIMEPRHISISYSLLNGISGEYEDNNGTTIETKTVTVKHSLQPGNKVMMIPDNSLKRWYVFDKVVSL